MQSKGEGTRVRFCSYNVLSSHLCSPLHHTHSKPEHLEPAVRFEKLLSKLEVEVENKSIISLQEVSELWSTKLATFFTNLNYFSYSRCYGSPFNGYMGVLIAFPLDLYKLEDLESKRLTDTVYWPDDEEHEIHNDRQYSKKTLKSLKQAQRKWNATLWARLMDKESKKTFCVGTYHCPVAFFDEKIQNLHTTLLIRFLQEASKGLPLIIGGDFNLKLDTQAYRMITTGKTDSLIESMMANAKEFRKISFGDEKKKQNKGKFKKRPVLKGLSSFLGMRSAYEKLQENGEFFTNHSWTKNIDRPFASCIDYIFISEEFDIVSVKELYNTAKDIAGETLPDEVEPSDHLLLATTLQF